MKTVKRAYKLADRSSKVTKRRASKYYGPGTNTCMEWRCPFKVNLY